MHVRAYFKNIDEVIATIKNKDRKKEFHDAGLPSPDHVIARWATCPYITVEPSSCSCHCQPLNKCRPLSQQSKRRYQCGRFGAGLG